jgi:C-terminal peptidase prc
MRHSISSGALGLLLWIGAVSLGGQPPSSPQVFETGNERAILEKHTGVSASPSSAKYANSLDQALATILSRAYPQPESKDIVTPAVKAICDDVEHSTRTTIPSARREDWSGTVCRTGSFETLLKEIKSLMGGAFEEKHIIETGVRGMACETGKTRVWLLNPAEAQEIKKVVDVRASGIEPGYVGLMLKPDRWPTVDVAPFGAAETAGMRNGDILVAINGVDVPARIKTMDEFRRLLAGPAGGEVRLSVRRGEEMLHFEVKRQSVSATMVTARIMEPGIIYIRIPTFEGSGVADKVKQILLGNNIGVKSVVILDVRRNPGGRPEEANAVASLFLDQRLLETFQYRDGSSIAFKAKAGDLGARVIILTNTESGSAAEMLAMALRDNGRGTIVGMRTAGALFGKDGAELMNGQFILFRTEPLVLSPTGKDYTLTGVTPDINVSDVGTAGNDEILRRALELARSERKNDGTPWPGP